MRRLPTYEIDEEAFPAEAYAMKGRNSGIAYRVYGWETEPAPDTDEETGEEYWDGETMQRTGRIVVVMVGDDRKHIVDPDDVIPLNDLDYCASCGQVGCTHDGRDREGA